jgi:hypothetical protein
VAGEAIVSVSSILLPADLRLPKVLNFANGIVGVITRVVRSRIYWRVVCVVMSELRRRRGGSIDTEAAGSKVTKDVQTSDKNSKTAFCRQDNVSKWPRQGW